LSSWQKAFVADDWGLSPAVNEAVLELAGQGLVASVSVMVNLPYWQQGLGRLLELGVPLELHWNFTLGRPVLGGAVPSLTDAAGHFYPLGTLLRRALLGQLRFSQLEAEASAQLGYLEGYGIRRVNGHQHLHLVPGFSSVLAKVARKHGIQEVRWTAGYAHWPTLATRVWCAPAWRHFRKIPVHPLWPTRGHSREELEAKREAAAGCLLITHPAARDDFQELEFADRLRAERVKEFESLRSLYG